MKKICALLLAMLLTVSMSACSESYSGSRLGNESELSMKYDVFNTTDSQLMKLEKGDVIDADIFSLSGKLSVTIQNEAGEAVFESEDLKTGQFQVDIDESGMYQITVTGRKARGSLSFKKGAGMESVIRSYYEGQDSRAFQMFNKSIFKNFSDDWTENIGELENPKWNYDSFAQYRVLDQELAPVDENEELYSCTFSDDSGRQGYLVMRYEGSGISKIKAVETGSLYDLQTVLNEVREGLKNSDADLSSAAAFRAKLMNADQTAGEEAIVVKDGEGHSYVYRFGGQS